MKHRKRILAIALGLALATAIGSLPVSGADYTAFSTEELAALRGTMWGATAEDRDAFRTEWHNRLSSMDTTQRRELMGNRGSGACGGICDGSGPHGGMGAGYGSGYGMGGRMGRGRR